jgi:hypothetical protein
VLGPRALTNPSQSPANTGQDPAAEAALRDLVRQKRLHESVAPSAQSSPALMDVDAAQLARIEGFTDPRDEPGYDENDEESFDLRAGGGPSIMPRSSYGGQDYGAGSDGERVPLSPQRKKDLPTSRVPIEPNDLARRPEELIDTLASSSGRRDEMHLKVSAPAAQNLGASISNTGPPTSSASLAEVSKAQSFVPLKSAPQADAFVESKTTGEFLRVSRAPQADGEFGLDGEVDPMAENKHDLPHFEREIDGIIDHVNGIQSFLSGVWLLFTGLLVGACLMQVYVVGLRNDDIDFLGYYSRFAGPARKLCGILCGFAVTLAAWRTSLERRDPDRHLHFINRYHQPNSSPWILGRNIVCATSLTISFLMTLLMVPMDNYIESHWTDSGAAWFSPTVDNTVTPAVITPAVLPDYYTKHIKDWYSMAFVRLFFASLALLCLLHRYTLAEHHALELGQERFENRLVARKGTFQVSNAQPAGGSNLGATSQTGMTNRKTLSASNGSGATVASFDPSASQRMGASQRFASGGLQGNAGMQRMDASQRMSGVEMTGTRR